MKLLVTGGAGYVGSVVAEQLVEAGHTVTVLDDLSRGHRDALPHAAQLVEADILDARATHNALRPGFDGVLHFAALSLVADSVRHPEVYWRANVLGARNLLDAMRAADTRRLVFSSTAAVYGEPRHVPITEDAATRPLNAYGRSKLAVDHMLDDECRAHGLAAVSLRYFNVAGASGARGEHHQPESHLIPIVLEVASGRRPHVNVFGTDYATHDGTAVRDYIHVEDLGAAHLLAVTATEHGRHRIFNLGNGAGYSVREVIEAAEKVTGRDIPTVPQARRFGDPAKLVASSEKIRDELRWTPRKAALETIIADAWAWHQANPNGYAN